MFRSSMRSSSVSSLFISLSMLLILKIIKIFKKYYQSIVVMWQHMFSMPVMLILCGDVSWTECPDHVSTQYALHQTVPTAHLTDSPR
jgi:predicted phosphohydrolase